MMIKKEYIKPTQEVLEIDWEVRFLIDPVSDITTTGLDDELEDSGGEGDPWEEAL